MSKHHIDSFLDLVASTLGYDLDSLTLRAELRGYGSATVTPRSLDSDGIVSTHDYKKGLPSADYDDLGSGARHIEYQIVQIKKQGKVEVPRVLYAWQHSPFFGNCGCCIHRWVRLTDNTKVWPQSLMDAAFKLRCQIARDNSNGLLFITVAGSFSGNEDPSKFEHLMSGVGRSPTKVYGLDIRKFLTGSK